jgi:hypothetical protein
MFNSIASLIVIMKGRTISTLNLGLLAESGGIAYQLYIN